MESFVSKTDVVNSSKGAVSATDPRIDIMLDGALAGIRRAAGWHIAPVQQDHRVLDGPGGVLLKLPTLKLVSIDSITNDGVALDVDGLEWSELGMVRGHWSSRFRGVDVTFTHGFDDAPDLKALVITVVLRGLSSPMGATREQAGQLSATWGTVEAGVSGGLMLTDKELATLARYRLEP